MLAKRPNYAIASRHPSYLEYITAIESVCTKLSQQDAEEPRSNIDRVLRGSPKSNLSKEKVQAIRELKGDRDRLALTADKGVAMVIIERQDYINKANNLLTQPVYRPIPGTPLTRLKLNL